MPRVRLSGDSAGFVRADTGAQFIVYGFNYDHDRHGRLLEDYWRNEWDTVAADFREMKALGANTVRIHLQTGRFMRTPDEPDADALKQLARLLRLAADTGLHLYITGLGCYHKQDTPPWYDAMEETARWEVQGRFWEAIAKICASSPAVLAYDLMNEPVVPDTPVREGDWLAVELAGKHYVQRITLNRGGRTPEQVADAWVKHLATAIRRCDRSHLITVGVIPWGAANSGERPLFYSVAACRHLDFVSVHCYPRKGRMDEALVRLADYQLGKPLVIAEMFPLECGQTELDQFIDRSRRVATGWLGFYWGQTIEECATETTSVAAAITRGFLESFRDRAADLNPPR